MNTLPKAMKEDIFLMEMHNTILGKYSSFCHEKLSHEELAMIINVTSFLKRFAVEQHPVSFGYKDDQVAKTADLSNITPIPIVGSHTPLTPQIGRAHV